MKHGNCTWYGGCGCWWWNFGWIRGGGATRLRGQLDVIKSNVTHQPSLLQSLKHHLGKSDQLNDQLRWQGRALSPPTCDCNQPSSPRSGEGEPDRSSSCLHSHPPSETPWWCWRKTFDALSEDGHLPHTCDTCKQSHDILLSIFFSPPGNSFSLIGYEVGCSYQKLIHIEVFVGVRGRLCILKLLSNGPGLGGVTI